MSAPLERRRDQVGVGRPLVDRIDRVDPRRRNVGVIGEAMRRDVQGAEGAEAALAEGDAGELGQVKRDGQVPLRVGQAAAKTVREGLPRQRVAARVREEVAGGVLKEARK